MSVITQPSETRHLPFMSAGIIRENLVKDGDHVKAGQVLMRQDSDLDKKEAEGPMPQTEQGGIAGGVAIYEQQPNWGKDESECVKIQYRVRRKQPLCRIDLRLRV